MLGKCERTVSLLAAANGLQETSEDAFESLLRRCIKTGDLTLIGANGEQRRFGDANAPRATVRLHDNAPHWKLALSVRALH